MHSCHPFRGAPKNGMQYSCGPTCGQSRELRAATSGEYFLQQQPSSSLFVLRDTCPRHLKRNDRCHALSSPRCLPGNQRTWAWGGCESMVHASVTALRVHACVEQAPLCVHTCVGRSESMVHDSVAALRAHACVEQAPLCVHTCVE